MSGPDHHGRASEESATENPAADASAAEEMPDRMPGNEAGAEPEWRRRRRLAQIFGDVLPETTGDERDPSEHGRASGESASDTWLRAQVPPHHGG